MKTQLAFNFVLGHYDNIGLNFEVSVDNTPKIHFTNLVVNELKFTLEVELPCKINFKISGTQDTDPVVDEFNNIVKDRFIEFKQLIITDFYNCSLDAWFLPDTHLYFQTEKEIGSKTYWSQAGTATFIIDEDDIIIWLLNHKSLIYSAT